MRIRQYVVLLKESFLAPVVVFFTLNANAQAPQEMFYVCRGDAEEMVAFNRTAVDSIVFADDHADGRFYIYTRDSVCRFSIAGVDSIAFSTDYVGEIMGWSRKNPISFAQPSCALVNITGVSEMPERKNTNAPAWMEVWDGYGHYFKKKVILDMQGNSSGAFQKKNFSADFYEADGRIPTDIRIGDWVAQDSYHFKAFHTSITKGECPVSYHLYDLFLAAKPVNRRAPYMDYAPEEWMDYEESVAERGFARCYPAGFPCVVYLNGQFYGIFSWQLKKHRGNFNMGRNNTDHICLDGDVGPNDIWNGIVKWSSFEVRNPKPKEGKWILTDINGNPYDGNYPKELLGADSPIFDPTNSSHVNTARTKNHILALSHYMLEIAVFEKAYSEASTAEKATALSNVKKEIEKRFSMEWMIDFVLLANIVGNGDVIYKNCQWTTWGELDGTVRWYVNPYDIDVAFGVNATTAFWFYDSGKSEIGNGSSTPLRYVWAYYRDEMKARYAELRTAGVISYETIFGLLKDWCDRVGEENYAKEAGKWPEMPCNRDDGISENWSYTGKYYITFWGLESNWTTTSTYAEGSFCKYKYRCYKSLRPDNRGHMPNEENSVWWQDMSVKPGIYHTGDLVYDGRCNYYQFRALKDVEVTETPLSLNRMDHLQGAPFEKLYSCYPYEGGVHDSLERLSEWVKRKIISTDEQMSYQR